MAVGASDAFPGNMGIAGDIGVAGDARDLAMEGAGMGCRIHVQGGAFCLRPRVHLGISVAVQAHSNGGACPCDAAHVGSPVACPAILFPLVHVLSQGSRANKEPGQDGNPDRDQDGARPGRTPHCGAGNMVHHRTFISSIRSGSACIRSHSNGRSCRSSASVSLPVNMTLFSGNFSNWMWVLNRCTM